MWDKIRHSFLNFNGFTVEPDSQCVKIVFLIIIYVSICDVWNRNDILLRWWTVDLFTQVLFLVFISRWNFVTIHALLWLVCLWYMLLWCPLMFYSECLTAPYTSIYPSQPITATKHYKGVIQNGAISIQSGATSILSMVLFQYSQWCYFNTVNGAISMQSIFSKILIKATPYLTHEGEVWGGFCEY